MTAKGRVPVGAVLVAAVALAAAVVAVLPQHAVSVIRVLLGAVAVIVLVGAALEALKDVRPAPPDPLAIRSPFESTHERRRFHRDRPVGLDRVRGELDSTTVRADVPALSQAASRRLESVVATRLAHEGLDLHDPAHRPAVQARLSPRSWAAVTAERSLRTLPGRAPRPRRLAPADEIAATVHAVLDELDHPPTPRGTG